MREIFPSLAQFMPGVKDLNVAPIALCIIAAMIQDSENIRIGCVV